MHLASKPIDQRDTGISELGRMPWSTHFSLFYETPADLVDTVVPYFKAGLTLGELCVWMPSGRQTEKDAEAALRRMVPDFDRHLEDHDVEFISVDDWYRPGGSFDARAVMQRWRELDDRVRKEGYAGLRGSGDMTWLDAVDWRAFADYEETLHRFLRNRRMMILCTYPLAQRRATDVLDSLRAHHFALTRRRGKWDVVETSALKKTKEQIQQLNEELELRVTERTQQLARSETYLEEGQRLSHTGSFAFDAATQEYTYVSPENHRIFGFDTRRPVRRADLLARIHPDDRAKVQERYEQVAHGLRDMDVEFRIVLPDRTMRYIYTICHPVVDASGRLVEIIGTDIDITDRKRASAKLARAKRLARERTLEARFAAALEERTRLAREIHDSLLQGVTGIALQLRATLPRLRATATPVRDSILRVVELAETTIRDARRAVWDMRAPSLVQKGLPDALEEAVRRAAGRVKLEFVVEGKPHPLRAEVDDTFFRVGQEAVLNAMKHASPRHLKVTLVYKPRSARLTVSDDGSGFDVEQAFRAYAGRWGLLGMRERADRIGASLTIRSQPNRGTTVDLRVPVAATGKAR